MPNLELLYLRKCLVWFQSKNGYENLVKCDVLLLQVQASNISCKRSSILIFGYFWKHLYSYFAELVHKSTHFLGGLSIKGNNILGHNPKKKKQTSASVNCSSFNTTRFCVISIRTFLLIPFLVWQICNLCSLWHHQHCQIQTVSTSCLFLNLLLYQFYSEDTTTEAVI